MVQTWCKKVTVKSWFALIQFLPFTLKRLEKEKKWNTNVSSVNEFGINSEKRLVYMTTKHLFDDITIKSLNDTISLEARDIYFCQLRSQRYYQVHPINKEPTIFRKLWKICEKSANFFHDNSNDKPRNFIKQIWDLVNKTDN